MRSTALGSSPKRVETGELGPGEIGYITASIKSVADCQVGDTLIEDRRPTEVALPGFRPTVPVVFCGLFPVDTNDYKTCARAWRNWRSTTRVCILNRRVRRPLASATAAVASACCIWRSSRNALTGSSISI